MALALVVVAVLFSLLSSAGHVVAKVARGGVSQEEVDDMELKTFAASSAASLAQYAGLPQRVGPMLQPFFEAAKGTQVALLEKLATSFGVQQDLLKKAAQEVNANGLASFETVHLIFQEAHFRPPAWLGRLMWWRAVAAST